MNLLTKNVLNLLSINNKAFIKISSYLLILSFFIIYQLYFSQSTQLIFAATPSPSPPTLTDTPDPQQGGSSVTFQFTCNDGTNNVEGYVCKQSNCANCGLGDTSQCWCASGSVASNPSCTYACPAGSTSTNNYYGRCRSSAGQYTTPTSLVATFTCIGTPQVPTGNIAIYKGWNLISFPHPESIGFVGNCENSILTYYHWDPSAVKWNVYKVQSLPTNGFWVYSNIECTMQYSGTTSIALISLSNGWNQIGSFDVEKNVIDVKNGCTIIQGPFYYDSQYSTWQTVTVLKPGRGHWILTDSSCSLH